MGMCAWVSLGGLRVVPPGSGAAKGSPLVVGACGWDPSLIGVGPIDCGKQPFINAGGRPGLLIPGKGFADVRGWGSEAAGFRSECLAEQGNKKNSLDTDNLRIFIYLCCLSV